MRRGHNGGPALEPARVDELRAEILHLQRAAKAAAAERLFWKEQELGPWRFFPSRLAKCSTDRALQAQIRAELELDELGRRQPQIARLERKIARLEASARSQ